MSNNQFKFKKTIYAKLINQPAAERRHKGENMKENRLNSLSVKLCDSQENDLHEVAEYLHLTIGIPNTKTAAIRHLIEKEHQQICEEIIRSNEG